MKAILVDFIQFLAKKGDFFNNFDKNCLSANSIPELLTLKPARLCFLAGQMARARYIIFINHATFLRNIESWLNKSTFRIWDFFSSKCFHYLVKSEQTLWFDVKNSTFRIWQFFSSKCLRYLVKSEQTLRIRHPENIFIIAPCFVALCYILSKVDLLL